MCATHAYGRHLRKKACDGCVCVAVLYLVTLFGVTAHIQRHSLNSQDIYCSGLCWVGLQNGWRSQATGPGSVHCIRTGCIPAQVHLIHYSMPARQTAAHVLCGFTSNTVQFWQRPDTTQAVCSC
jgi:hypothetical protein